MRLHCDGHRYSWLVKELPSLLSLLDIVLKSPLLQGVSFNVSLKTTALPHCKPKTTFQTAAMLRGTK